MSGSQAATLWKIFLSSPKQVKRYFQRHTEGQENQKYRWHHPPQSPHYGPTKPAPCLDLLLRRTWEEAVFPGESRRQHSHEKEAKPKLPGCSSIFPVQALLMAGERMGSTQDHAKLLGNSAVPSTHNLSKMPPWVHHENPLTLSLSISFG